MKCGLRFSCDSKRNCIYLNVKLEICEMLMWSEPTTHMSFSKNRMLSEFSNVLSSTVSSANLLPGNSESSAEDLKGSMKQKPIRPRDTHTFYCDGFVLDLTFQFPPPPLRKFPASQSLQSGPQYWNDQGRVSEDMMLMMGELQAWAHTALIDGHTWKQGHFAHYYLKLVFKIDKKNH